MTIFDIISQLIAEGHQVKYYKRKDGGYIIQAIDGVHYTGAKGNARAREMTGQTISEARMHQLKFATGTKKSLNSPSLKKVKIDDPIWEEYKRVKEIWNKAFKAKKGKHHPAGYFSKARIKKAIKNYGYGEAMRRISEAEKYASGYAYTKNIQHLADYVLDAANKLRSQELEDLARDILFNADTIREEWIAPAFDRLYDLNKGHGPKEVAKDVRKILRING